MSGVLIEALKQPLVEDRRVEIVDRKGTGHPDSMYDGVAEAVSLALCREYVETCGRVLHHNIDKALLVAGQTQSQLGGGAVLEPMRLVLGDRAMNEFGGKRIAVDEIAADTSSYFSRKEEIRARLMTFLQGKLHKLNHLSVQVNALDDPERGEGGMYLTVLGTSVEGGDCGQVGRGNRVNGLIPLNRPTSAEAAAGKNPISHVGKICSLLSQQVAELVVQEVAGVREVYVWLCSQIGHPLKTPLVTAVHSSRAMMRASRI